MTEALGSDEAFEQYERLVAQLDDIYGEFHQFLEKIGADRGARDIEPVHEGSKGWSRAVFMNSVGRSMVNAMAESSEIMDECRNLVRQWYIFLESVQKINELAVSRGILPRGRSKLIPEGKQEKIFEYLKIRMEQLALYVRCTTIKH